MNEKLFTEMTGKRPRTAAENAKHYAEQDKAFRLRLAALPEHEAIAICRKYVGTPEYAGHSAFAVASEYIASHDAKAT